MNRLMQLDSQIRFTCAETPPTTELEGKIFPEVYSKGDQKIVQALKVRIVLNVWLSLVDIRFPYILDKHRKDISQVCHVIYRPYGRDSMNSVYFVRIV